MRFCGRLRWRWRRRGIGNDGIGSGALFRRRLVRGNGRSWRHIRSRGQHVEDGGRGFDFDDRIVGQERAAHGANLFEVGEGAAIETLGLHLEPQQKLDFVGFAVEAAEALVEREVAILLDGNVGVLQDLGIKEAEGAAIGAESLIEGGGVKAVDQAIAAHEVLLGDSEPFEGEKLLGIGWLIGCDEVGAQARDGLDVFYADDGIGAGFEDMFACAHA
jgi:hypothetical protein